MSCFLHLPLPLSLPREWSAPGPARQAARPAVQCSFVCGSVVCVCVCVWHSTRHSIARDRFGLYSTRAATASPLPALEPQPSRERRRCTETITKQKTQRPPLAKLTGFVARPGPTCAQDNGGTISPNTRSLRTAMHHHQQPRLVRNGGG